MTAAPVTLFFDVNETLSDLSTVGDAFDRLGVGRGLAGTWFGSVLRDGFALTSVGGAARFADIAATNARNLLAAAEPDGDLDKAVDTVMAAFSAVAPHPDVAEGLRALRAGGHRMFTLSNGPASTAERLLGNAGLLDLFDGLLSVEGHTAWKPVRASYLYALNRTGIGGTAYLVAVHPWDIHGAAEAGLSTAWINRNDAQYPAHFRRPAVTAVSIVDLAEQLNRPAANR
jgi:2-haloacid dehalogenase